MSKPLAPLNLNVQLSENNLKSNQNNVNKSSSLGCESIIEPEVSIKLFLYNRTSNAFIQKFTLPDLAQFFKMPYSLRSFDSHPELINSLIDLGDFSQKTLKVDLRLSCFVSFIERVVEKMAIELFTFHNNQLKVRRQTSSEVNSDLNDHCDFRLVKFHLNGPSSKNKTAHFSLQPNSVLFPLSDETLKQNLKIQKDFKLAEFLMEINKPSNVILSRTIDCSSLLATIRSSKGLNYKKRFLHKPFEIDQSINLYHVNKLKINFFVDCPDFFAPTHDHGDRLMKFFVLCHDHEYFLTHFAFDPNDGWILVPIENSSIWLYPEVTEHPQIKRRLRQVQRTACFTVWANMNKFVSLCERFSLSNHKLALTPNKSEFRSFNSTATLKSMEKDLLVRSKGKKGLIKLDFTLYYRYDRFWVTHFGKPKSKNLITIPKHLQEVSAHPAVQRRVKLQSLATDNRRESITVCVQALPYAELCTSLLKNLNEKVDNAKENQVSESSSNSQIDLMKIFVKIQKHFNLIAQNNSIDSLFKTIRLISKLKKM